jgi:diketogulonate reductase-like aldo/keto reductase
MPAAIPEMAVPSILPPILYGTAWKRSATASHVATAVHLGFRGIDTACQPKHYDEAGVGAGLALVSPALRRDELYLQTKFTPLTGQDPTRIPYDAHAPLAEQVHQSCAASLRNLQTTYLDCLLLHSPLASLQLTQTAWRAAESLVANGSVRRLGISNCYELDTLERLHVAAEVKPAVLQNRFHAATGYDRELRAFCRDHGIVYQSFWTLTANPHLLGHEVVRTSAQHHRRTAAQVLFRYLTQQGVTPLTGTTSQQHMQEDLAIFAFTLSANECATITSLLET